MLAGVQVAPELSCPLSPETRLFQSAFQGEALAQLAACYRELQLAMLSSSLLGVQSKVSLAQST